MKNHLEEAYRWIKEAYFNIVEAKDNLELSHYSLVCFLSEQSAQKSLKSFLFYFGIRHTPIHSIRELLLKCKEYDKNIMKFERESKILDLYYIPTRYPDAQPFPAVPYEEFSKEQALEALSMAQNIYEFVKIKIGFSEPKNKRK